MRSRSRRSRCRCRSWACPTRSCSARREQGLLSPRRAGRTVEVFAARLVDTDGGTTETPESVLHPLKLVLQTMAQDQTVTLVPHGKELTTQGAAGLLHVSRPHLIKLLDQGIIPHHKVGTHRRLQVEDVLAYRAERDTTRREKLDELIRISEELPGGYR